MYSLNQNSPSPNNNLDFTVLNDDEQPKDSISAFSWGRGSQNRSFVCSAWDSTIRLYDITTEGTTQVKQKACFQTDDPCVSVSFCLDTGTILAGCINNSILQVDPESRAITTIGSHSDAVKDVYWCQDQGLVLSLSYDKTLKVWDPRTQSPVQDLDIGQKIICSTFNFGYLVMGLGDSKIMIGKLAHILAENRNLMPGMQMGRFCTSPSPFEGDEQLTSLALGQQGFSTFKIAAGSDYGNVNISLYETLTYGNVPFRSQTTFRPHKTTVPRSTLNMTVRPVQAVDFFPHREDLIYTMGAEGAGYAWNYQNKRKIYTMMNAGIPVTKAQMSFDGRFIAYSLGYDWSQGIEGSEKYKTKLYVHQVNDERFRQSERLDSLF